MLKAGLSYDTQTNGPWEDLQTVADMIIERVIPRLLGLLQEEPRNIKPSPLH